MRAVTKGRRLSLLAAAKPHRFCFFGLQLDGLELGPLMGIIAKRLLVAQPAGTPKIGLSLRDLEFIRFFLGDMRFVHGCVSLVARIMKKQDFTGPTVPMGGYVVSTLYSSVSPRYCLLTPRFSFHCRQARCPMIHSSLESPMGNGGGWGMSASDQTPFFLLSSRWSTSQSL